MNKEVYCLRFTRDTSHTPTILCVFDIPYNNKLSESDKKLIIDVINKNYSFILEEFAINQNTLISQLILSKYNRLRFKNIPLRCQGFLELERIELFKCSENV